MRFVAIMAFFFSSIAFGATKGSGKGGSGPTLRLIAGAASPSPAEVNKSFESQGLEKVSSSLLLGGELGFAFDRVELGMRYLSNQVRRAEKPDVPNVEYVGSIKQDLLLAMVHVPVVKGDYARFDLFGGFGGVGSQLKVKSSSQKGELKRSLLESAAWTGGASLSLGYKSFFISFEGGYLGNKSRDFSRSGTINQDIQTLEMSGGYAAVSLLFFGGGVGGVLDWIGKVSAK